MAPMAGITDLPFRLLVKRSGAGMVVTEMVSAMGLHLNQKKTLGYLKTHREESPLSVQIFGAEPDVMARAAETAVAAGAAVVDINMGCPAKKVVKTGAGGALLKTPQQARKIVSSVRRACTVPLTVKIRSGWSPSGPLALEFARMMEDCGADAVAVHPRYVSQGFSGRADWRTIEAVKKGLRIPVIGNGDVWSPEHAVDMKRTTGCDGVMIGRGAVGNPWIFRQAAAVEKGLPWAPPSLSERRSMIEEHFRLLSEAVGEVAAGRRMRGLLLRYYTKGLPRSSAFRETVSRIADRESLVSAVDGYFSFLEGARP